MSTACGSGLHVHPACLQEGREVSPLRGGSGAGDEKAREALWAWVGRNKEKKARRDELLLQFLR